MADTIEERCERLRQPVTELVAMSMAAVYRSQDVPELVRVIGVVRAILAEDASGLPAGALRDWLPTGQRVLDRMSEAVESGDAAKSYAILTDQQDGFIRLTDGCAGFPGWSVTG
ncbi:hypothetical protein BJ978_001786 [Agromyces terreus]|uniref:Uncharacterized protein n=1 Tax=Agromyces terreus TaxID=424795 RepID=A0A9X2KCD0_9MICO|nr:hypothetical protein [Agromyces terreus]MCP2371110.1 hypothetical protein [Agromyces terreus]